MTSKVKQNYSSKTTSIMNQRE